MNYDSQPRKNSQIVLPGTARKKLYASSYVRGVAVNHNKKEKK